MGKPGLPATGDGTIIDCTDDDTRAVVASLEEATTLGIQDDGDLRYVPERLRRFIEERVGSGYGKISAIHPPDEPAESLFRDQDFFVHLTGALVLYRELLPERYGLFIKMCEEGLRRIRIEGLVHSELQAQRDGSMPSMEIASTYIDKAGFGSIPWYVGNWNGDSMIIPTALCLYIKNQYEDIPFIVRNANVDESPGMKRLVTICEELRLNRFLTTELSLIFRLVYLYHADLFGVRWEAEGRGERPVEAAEMKAALLPLPDLYNAGLAFGGNGDGANVVSSTKVWNQRGRSFERDDLLRVLHLDFDVHRLILADASADWTAFGEYRTAHLLTFMHFKRLICDVLSERGDIGQEEILHAIISSRTKGSELDSAVRRWNKDGIIPGDVENFSDFVRVIRASIVMDRLR